MVGVFSSMANRFRQWAQRALAALRRELGGKCSVRRCKATDQLEFDCIIPVGHEHHEWETNRRAVFYRRQHREGNLQLLCDYHHRKKSAKEQDWRISAKKDDPF